MDEYLNTTTNLLKTKNYGELTLVLGNESCDLDSAVSSIVYAAFLNWQYNQIKCKVCTRASRDESVYKDDVFVPVLNVDREDYSLKSEVTFALQEHGIDESKLVFRNDYDIKQLVASTKTNVVLVDHHVLAKTDRYLAPFVTEIIDHRPMDKTEWMYKEDTRSTIETVGSCCTLVAQRIKNLSALVANDVAFFQTYPVCSELLHAAIILDTVNFSKQVDKTTPHDVDIVMFLESILKPRNYEENRKCTLERLQQARSDVSAWSAAQLLQKDVKVVGDVLVPSLPILVEEYLQRPAAVESIEPALEKNGCRIAVLLGMSLVDGLRRDAAVYCAKDTATADRLAQHLQEWATPSLNLAPKPLSFAPTCLYFTQENLGASRKQYIPAIQAFLTPTK